MTALYHDIYNQIKLIDSRNSSREAYKKLATYVEKTEKICSDRGYPDY